MAGAGTVGAALGGDCGPSALAAPAMIATAIEAVARTGVLFGRRYVMLRSPSSAGAGSSLDVPLVEQGRSVPVVASASVVRTEGSRTYRRSTSPFRRRSGW